MRDFGSGEVVEDSQFFVLGKGEVISKIRFVEGMFLRRMELMSLLFEIDGKKKRVRVGVGQNKKLGGRKFSFCAEKLHERAPETKADPISKLKLIPKSPRSEKEFGFFAKIKKVLAN